MYATLDGTYCCKYNPDKPTLRYSDYSGDPPCDVNDPTVMKKCINNTKNWCVDYPHQGPLDTPS
jgi:hypothetical protein